MKVSECLFSLADDDYKILIESFPQNLPLLSYSIKLFTIVLLKINGIIKWHALRYISVRGSIKVPFIFLRGIIIEILTLRS